jgi:threonine aldolase
MVSFSKGLGAPVGAALAGTAEGIGRCWEIRKRLGGGMRQSGIIAAGALHGLEHHLARMTEDHARARQLAEAVDGIAGARVVAPDTNIVMIDLRTGLSSFDIVNAAAELDVLLTPWSPTRIRAVTHLDADDAAVRRAGSVLAELLEAA